MCTPLHELACSSTSATVSAYQVTRIVSVRPAVAASGTRASAAGRRQGRLRGSGGRGVLGPQAGGRVGSAWCV